MNLITWLLCSQVRQEPWLVDVGLGLRFPVYPLQILLHQEQTDETGVYRIIPFDSQYLAVEKKQAREEWLIAYIFTLHPRGLQQFSGMCTYHQISPESYFTQNKLCSIAIPHGRITLTDNAFTYTKHAHIIKQNVSGTDEF